jgi:pimeloyl-ACP methyl ester carboxylesterase
MRRSSAPGSLRSWVFRCTLALLVAFVLTSAPQGANASGRTNTLPTIVLVHGAWADSSSWDAVVPLPHHDGYRTITPDLTLTSIARDIATVRAVLDATPGPKILVAHSYGGIVISGAAFGRTDITALVYSAAFVPAAGDSILTLGIGFHQSEAFNHLAFTGLPFASPTYIAPNLFAQYFAQDLPPEQAATLDAAQQPLNFPIVLTPSGSVGWHTIPSWYAVSGSDKLIDPAEERWMVNRAGAHTVVYADSSHAGGITRYARQFTALIEQAFTALIEQA